MRGTLAERFWTKVNKDGPLIVPALGPCWVWTASRTKLGYGKCSLGGNDCWVHASRVAFFLAEGRWPEPFACHHCDYPPCCKAEADALGPAHIYEGDQKRNMSDCAARGRNGLHAHPERAARGDRSGARTHPEARPRGTGVWLSKLTDDQVRMIRVRYATGLVTQQSLADEYGVTQSNVGMIVSGRTWRHVV